MKMVTSWVASVGRRIVDAIPEELRHAEFRYTFQVVNVREINAFALPGGPMYVNRGMIQAARTEGEVAGVMAHELSHVALRHGTAQATKATKYEIGTLLGAVVGSIIGGNVGSAVAQGTQFGLGTAFLQIQPRVRARRRSARVAHHGPGRVRPARDGQHVQDDREAGRLGRPAVAERSSRIPATATRTSPAKRRRSRCATSYATRARSHRPRRDCAGWRRRRRRKRPRATRRAGAAPRPRRRDAGESIR